MFNIRKFSDALEAENIKQMSEQLDILLSEYLERNINEAYYRFKIYFNLLSFELQKKYKVVSVFHDELMEHSKLTA
jgi:hypothetical protein